MKWLLSALLILTLSLTAHSFFTGVSIHNSAKGPVQVKVKCFLGDHSWVPFVLDEGQQDKLPIVCPNRGE